MSMFMSRLRGKLLGLGGGVLLLMAAGVGHAGTVTYVYTDPQGTPLAEANASGTITATFDYAPYGSIALGTAPNGPGYTGHVNDPESGLVYMQARYYDPSVGRFLSTDPVEPSAGNAFNFNRYAYVNNNPIGNTDPTGMFPSLEDVCSHSAFPCQTTGSVGGGGAGGGNRGSNNTSGGQQNLDDEITASVNQLHVGNDVHDVLQAYAIAFSTNYFAEKWRDPNGVFFGGRPDIGNVFTKELWEIKSAMSAGGAQFQLAKYSMFSGGVYRAGNLPSFFGGSSSLSLPGVYGTYNYQFIGSGTITYTYSLKPQYRYQPIGRGYKVVMPTNIPEFIEMLSSEAVLVP